MNMYCIQGFQNNTKHSNFLSAAKYSRPCLPAPLTSVQIHFHIQGHVGFPESSESTSLSFSSGPTENNVRSAARCLQNHFRYGDSNPGILRERQVCWPPTSYRSGENPLLTQPEKNWSAEDATLPPT